MDEDWIRLPVSEGLRREFRSGGWQEWGRRYPMLFDDDDKRNAIKQAARGLYFYEWLTAMAIYENSGYLSLVTKYAFPSHKKKWRIFNEIAPQPVLKLLSRDKDRGYGGTQGPDLFVYKPDATDWFFVEVKGLTDRMRPPQKKLFEELELVSGRDVLVAKFARVCSRVGRRAPA
jgi:hypothetical protein